MKYCYKLWSIELTNVLTVSSVEDAGLIVHDMPGPDGQLVEGPAKKVSKKLYKL